MQAPVIRGGFQFVNESRSPDSILGERMYVDSDRLRQAAAYINEHHVLSLVFTPALYKLDDLDFLRELPGVQGLYLQKSFPDLSPVYALKGLRVLRLQDVSSDFDLGAFPELEVVSYHDSKYAQHAGACGKLFWLGVDGYKKDNLEEFRDLLNLQYLSVYGTSIINLKGVEKLEKLKEIRIDSARKLTSLEGLNRNLRQLEYLDICSAAKLSQYEPIGSLPSLKHLELRKTGEIRSIAFLETLPALEWVTLGLKVVDGDMSVLKKMGKVGFIDHPHYTHKMKDFQA
jgi:hypothetical protein